MRQINKIIVFAITVITIFSCNEIMLNIEDPIIPESGRVVLIEELTGASCPNCPKGSAAIEFILNKYPDKVAVIGVHGNFLAQPIKDKSKYDFRNQKAKDLEKWLEPWYGKPAATTNRILTEDPQEPYAISSPDLWLAEVERELQKPNQMNILLAVDYDENKRTIDLDVSVIPLVDLAGNYNISVYLTESDIIDAQSNGSEYIEDYEHKHVLMDMLTNATGDSFGSNLTANSIIKKQFPTYTLPVKDGLFNPEKMEVVVMVSKSDVGVRDVIQAAHVKVKE
ncbi:MAG TPA: Omp28-related outer membrane protein [Saprospiraceae bacterium]|nr:Omp28-related outer membrane protein [Saprospiraceae bacterium]